MDFTCNEISVALCEVSMGCFNGNISFNENQILLVLKESKHSETNLN